MSKQTRVMPSPSEQALLAQIHIVAIGDKPARQRFQRLLDKHEQIMSKILHTEPVKSLYFSDFNGSVKSLGAWGGDFILAASDEVEQYVFNYFNSRNLNTIFRYDEIIMFQ